jgi:hypothetical protein
MASYWDDYKLKTVMQYVNAFISLTGMNIKVNRMSRKYHDCVAKAKDIAIGIERYIANKENMPDRNRPIEDYFAPEFPVIEEYGFENNVLVLGLNPSEGGNKRAGNDNKYNIFNYLPIRKKNAEESIDVIKEVQDLTYSKYFRPYVEYFTNLKAPYYPLWYNEKYLNTILNDTKHSKVLTPKIKSHMKTYCDDDNKSYIIFADLIQYAKTDSKPIIESLNDTKRAEAVKEYIIELLDYLKPKLVLSANAAVSHFLLKHLGGIDDNFTHIKSNGTTIFLASMLTGQRAMDVFSRNRLFKEMTDFLRSNL